jgi:fucokinase
MARARIRPDGHAQGLEDARGFDLLVLTVANDVQRRYAERMLEFRRRLGALPAGLETRVVSDPGGRRVGSGGSTLLCMADLARRGSLRGRRVLILHSGGDSRRLPSWSAFGKIWVPLGRHGRGLGPMNVPALFDLLLAELSTLALPAAGGVVVASGDAALRLTGERIALDGRDATVVAFPAGPARAARHGVFVVDRRGCVRRTMQKPTRAQLAAAGALDARGQAIVDGGIFCFPPAACAALLRGARPMLAAIRRGELALDLYQEVAEAMASDATRASYLARFAAGADRARLTSLARFFDATHRVRLRTATLSAGSFLHLGSTRELIERLASREPERIFPERLGAARTDLKPHELRITHDPDMPLGCCVSDVRIRGGICTLAHGIDDDCKTDAAHGGTLCGRPLSGLPARTGMTVRAIWGRNPHTLWHARIHPVDREGHWLHVRWMMDGSDAPAGWKRARKVSFADLMRLADPERTAHDDLVNHHLPRTARAPLDRARVAAGCEAIAADAASRARERTRALSAVGDAIAADLSLAPVVRRFGVRRDQAVWASAPVRVDLAGGWSDTPPLCIEHGGCVVNVAVKLGGTLPVQAMVRVTDEPMVSVHSVDAGRTGRYASVRELLAHDDPTRWDALPKAAIVLSGLVPRDPGASLRRHLERAGGGLAVTLFSAVPRGSGLGTSSILGATLLAALARVAGRAASRDRIAASAALLEQMIRTRGGWQDQVGGLWGGFKRCATHAGGRQVPAVAPIAVPDRLAGSLRARTLLVFSGERRMARGILETVVLRYLRGEPAVLSARGQLVEGAEAMAVALRTGDADAFARRLDEYRRLKATVDPASVSEDLARLVASLGPGVEAWSPAGAGGGGFLYVVFRSPAAARAAAARLARRPPNPLARAFPFEPDGDGLRLAVL